MNFFGLRRGRPPVGEFARARLRLTAWYAGLLLLLLGLIGGLAYALMTDRLDAQVDAALEDEVLASAPRLGQLIESGSDAPRPDVEPSPARTAGDEDDEGEEHRGAEETAEDALHELAGHGQLPTHQLLLDLNGDLLESTLTAASTALRAPIRAAGEQLLDIRTVTVGSERVRVRTQQVLLDGQPIGYVQAFRSLEDRDAAVADLVQILLIAGSLGGALALSAGFWLAGRALDPIRRNVEAQEQFIADASHELRAPIAIVQSSADVLLRHPEHRVADEREVVEGIAEEAKRMGTLVHDLLGLRLAEQLPLERDEVDLRALAVDESRSFAAIAEERGVQILVAPGEPLSVRGHTASLARVVRILLDNGITHTGHGSTVRLEVRRSGDVAALVVTDDGPGIAPEEQVRVFERFARVDQSRSRADGSSGLGLSIARALVTSHGGDITLHSQPGHGATFTVRLPLRG